MDAGGGMEDGADMYVDVAVSIYAGVSIGMDVSIGMYVDGADAAMDTAAACASITSLPVRSRYISCHALATSAIKIFDS
jgi:hypothetical protein